MTSEQMEMDVATVTENVVEENKVVVVEEPVVLTFAQALQSAVSALVAEVGTLNTARGGVEAAAENVALAETQLLSAQSGKREAGANVTRISQSALLARDEVVSILQSWNP